MDAHLDPGPGRAPCDVDRAAGAAARSPLPPSRPLRPPPSRPAHIPISCARTLPPCAHAPSPLPPPLVPLRASRRPALCARSVPDRPPPVSARCPRAPSPLPGPLPAVHFRPFCQIRARSFARLLPRSVARPFPAPDPGPARLSHPLPAPGPPVSRARSRPRTRPSPSAARSLPERLFLVARLLIALSPPRPPRPVPFPSFSPLLSLPRRIPRRWPPTRANAPPLPPPPVFCPFGPAAFSAAERPLLDRLPALSFSFPPSLPPSSAPRDPLPRSLPAPPVARSRFHALGHFSFRFPSAQPHRTLRPAQCHAPARDGGGAGAAAVAKPPAPQPPAPPLRFPFRRFCPSRFSTLPPGTHHRDQLCTPHSTRRPQRWGTGAGAREGAPPPPLPPPLSCAPFPRPAILEATRRRWDDELASGRLARA